MQDPVPPPKFRHICPTCNRLVEPGYKFCETCGTRIPELSTCSKCGTQFIAPVKYCDLCGARVIPGEVPEPVDSPEYHEEENNGPFEDQASEQDEEEIPEPETDELPEDTGEEPIKPAEDETPHHNQEEIQEPDTDELLGDTGEEPIEPAEEETRHHTKVEIQEPDTDELLEQFGKEYDDDETLESCHKPKPGSTLTHEAKKPGRVPAPKGRVSPGTVDDVLFLSPGKHRAPAKPRVNRTRVIAGCIVLTAIIAAVYFIGLPMLTGSGGFNANSNPPAAQITTLTTPVGTIPPAMTTTPVPALRALVPLPTQLIPSGRNIYFQVQKNPVTSRIQVIFTGSAGQGSLSSADIKVTHPDGSVATGIIQPLKGVSEITLDGSKETDRVEIIAKMSSGETYRVRDELLPGIRL
jgi:hypothetical protein